MEIMIYLNGEEYQNLPDPVINGNEAHILITTPLLSDGYYSIQTDVIFENLESGSNYSHIIIDNSAPVWQSSGIWINGISQFSLANRQDDNVLIYTNDEFSVQVLAQDLHSNLTSMYSWLEDGMGDVVWAYNFINGNETSIDIFIEDSLENLYDGIYHFYLNLTSEGGTIKSQPITIQLDMKLP
ncbi:hypothetical protein ES708_10582 [subsurface metagenome]